MTCRNTTPKNRTGSTPAITDVFRYRYGKMELAVLSDRRLTANDRLVYATLKAHRHHKTGTAWPSRQVIGAIAGCSDRAVSLATSRLVQAGYLTKQQRTGQSTLYGFPLAETPERAFPPTPERTFTHNKQFSEQKKEQPQIAKPAETSGSSVVVVPSVSNPHNSFTRVGQFFNPVESMASKAGIQIEAEPAPVSPVESMASKAGIQIEAEPAPVSPVESMASKAGIQIEAEPAPVSPVESMASKAGIQIEAEPAAPVAAKDMSLTFPVFVTLAIQAQMVRMLCGLPFADAQRLLDELNGAGQTRTIKNPVGYLRTLLRLFLADELIWEHADKIASLRASQARNQAALQRAMNLHPGGRPPDTPRSTEKRDQSVRLAEMAKIRAVLGCREAGSG
jgi:hypothetical protein